LGDGDGRIVVQGQLGQKVSKTPSQKTSCAMVAHTCNPSYMGVIS
jgi:hypothetical protein